jgi:NADH:ubiquinone oxidoreductase subunit C
MSIKAEIKERLGNKIINWNQHAPRRFYLGIKKEDIIEVTKVMFKDLSLRFNTASGIDTPLGFEILYHFTFDKTGELFSLCVLIEDKKKPEIDSIANIFPGAEWIEREMWELLGINFKNHPNLKRLLLADEWPECNYPLRQNEP